MNPKRRLTLRWWVPLALAAGVGCGGQLESKVEIRPPGSGPGSGPGAGPGAETRRALAPTAYNGRPSPLRRLARDEVVATLRRLTGSAPPRSELPSDLRPVEHAPLRTAGVPFIPFEVDTLHQVLGAFAVDIAPAQWEAMNCRLSGSAQRDCLTEKVSALAEAAFRRRLLRTERSKLASILESASGTKAVDVVALRGALAGIFVAPSFLYRVEAGRADSADAPRLLTQRELAVRLAFLATLGPPDEALLLAASAGLLDDPEERRRQLLRLSSTAEGWRAQSTMVLEWLGANEPKLSQKGDEYLEGLPANAEAVARASAHRVVERVLKGDSPTVGALFTATDYLSEAALAAFFTRDGDQTGRQGLLMHPNVIAAHTKENGASPFQVGPFLREAVLCQTVGPPPDGATDLARTDPPPGLSIREDLEYRTSAGTDCIACHGQFAPLGYAFLAFDPVGRWIPQDPTGKAWNLGGAATLFDGSTLSFLSPSELSQKLAAEPQVHGCFTRAAVQWAFGRGLTQEDEPLLAQLDDVALRTGGSLPEILGALVADPAFVAAVTR